MSFLKRLFDSVAKISLPIFNFDKSNGLLSFKKNDSSYFTYSLGASVFKQRTDSLVLEGYTVNSKNIFLEYVRLNSSSQWNGLSTSLYFNFLKDELKIDIEVLERHSFKNYDFYLGCRY